MTFKYDTARPYAACFVILRRDDGKIALVLRKTTGWMDDHYGLPAGKVEKFETFLQGAVREVKEETGVDVAPEDLRHVLTVHRDAPYDNVESDMSWVDVIFETNKWDGDPYNAEPTVHGELSWFDPNNLPTNMVPAVKFSLDCISKGETYAEFEWGQR